MLKSLHIENYRLFKQLDVPKLGRVNLITGKNNVGKTALLEAVRICVSGDPSVIQNIIYERGNWGGRYPKKDYSSIFFQEDYIDKAVEINNVKFSINSLPRHEQGYLTFNASTLSFDLSIGNPKLPRDTAILVNTKIDQNNNYLWGGIALTPKEEMVIDILRIIEPSLAAISVSPDLKGTKIRLKYARNPIPIKNLGDGIQRLLTIAMSLVSAENSYLLIDEFDIGLYYDVQEELWDIIFRISKELNVQVFATTHSQDCIRAFTEVALKYEEEESQYFRLQRKRKGDEIIVIDYTSKDLEVAIEQQIETR